MTTGRPRVFIIESLRFDDEAKQRHEGQFLSQILRLSGSDARYFYIRTKKELDEVLDQFDDSEYRYLHFSCHGDEKGIELTLDHLYFSELRKFLSPVLTDRRVFFSSCKIANKHLAKALLKGTVCYSVIGPSTNITFDRAAIFCASFYHLMLRDDAASMRRFEVSKNVAHLQQIFDVRMRY